MSKVQQPQKTFNRDSEIRIRNVDPEIKKELAEIQKLLRLPFESYTVEHLVKNYRGDQTIIKQLRQKNDQLHAALMQMQKAKEQLLITIRLMNEHNESQYSRNKKNIKRLLTSFKSGTVKATGGHSRKVASSTSVPKKTKSTIKKS